MDDKMDLEWSETGRKRNSGTDDQEKSCIPHNQSSSNKVCVIHYENVKYGDSFIFTRDFNSLTSILNAVKIRPYTAITDIALH